LLIDAMLSRSFAREQSGKGESKKARAKEKRWRRSDRRSHRHADPRRGQTVKMYATSEAVAIKPTSSPYSIIAVPRPVFRKRINMTNVSSNCGENSRAALTND
jgi:hypothetical protein